MLPKDTPLMKVQRLTLLLADHADDQRAVNDSIVKTLAEMTGLFEKMEAANGLLEARVQMLEADNGTP